jgi:hypothetical protein
MCDVILRSASANIGGFAVFGSSSLVALLQGYGKTSQLVGNAADLVVRGNDALTINIVLSERVTEFSAVVRKERRY